MSLDALRKFGFSKKIEAPEHDHITVSGKGRGAQHVLTTQLAQFDQAVEKIKQDNHLSPEGRAEKIKTAGQQALAEIAKLDSYFVKPTKQKLAQLKVQVSHSAGLMPTHDPAEVLREREVRDLLRAMDEGQRILALNEAVEQNDELVVRAVLLAPRIGGLFAKKLLQQVQGEWFRRQAPQTAAELAEAEETFAVVEENIRDVTSGIRQEAGL